VLFMTQPFFLITFRIHPWPALILYRRPSSHTRCILRLSGLIHWNSFAKSRGKGTPIIYSFASGAGDAGVPSVWWCSGCVTSDDPASSPSDLPGVRSTSLATGVAGTPSSFSDEISSTVGVRARTDTATFTSFAGHQNAGSAGLATPSPVTWALLPPPSSKWGTSPDPYQADSVPSDEGGRAALLVFGRCCSSCQLLLKIQLSGRSPFSFSRAYEWVRDIAGTRSTHKTFIECVFALLSRW